MKNNFKDPEQLINALYKGRKLIKEMFQHRRDIDFSKEDAYQFVSDDILQYFLNKGIIREYDNKLEISEKYLNFLEGVLHTRELITSSLIADKLESLKDNIRHYLMQRNNPRAQIDHIKNIGRILRDIPEIADNNADDLRDKVNNTFKGISNYDVKRDELQKYRRTVDDICKLINETHDFLNDNHSVFLDFSPDFSISTTITEVRLKLNEISRDLIERQKVICDYLNQIEYQSHLIKKLRKIKNLKDQMLWESATNVKEVIDKESSLFFNPLIITLRPSLSYLMDTDEGLSIVEEVRNRLNRKVQRQEISVPVLTKEERDIKPEIREIVDIEALGNSYFASGLDLFRFVINYKFQSDRDFESRVSIYIQLFSENVHNLEIRDEIETFGNVSYPLIYPKSN